MIAGDLRTRGTSRLSSFTVFRLMLLAGALCATVAVYVAPMSILAAATGLVVTVVLTLRYPVAGVCLIAIAVPWGSSLVVGSGSVPITPTDLIAGELTAAWLIHAAVIRRNPLHGSPLIPYIALYVGAVMLSLTQATDVKASSLEVVKWLEFACVYLATSWFLRTRRQLRLVAGALVLGGVSEAFLGFYQFILQAGPEAFGLHRAFFRSYGTFDQPNPYAGYLNMVLPFAFALSFRAPSRRERLAYSCSTGVIGVAVLASQSRGALLAGVVALTLVSLTLFPRIRAVAAPGATAALVIALAMAFDVLPSAPVTKVLSSVGLSGVSFGTVNDSNFSTIERAAHWLAGVRMFAYHPILGVGIGNYRVAYPQVHPRGWYASLDHAHNYYINIAAEGGIVALTAYILMIGSALWYIDAIRRRVADHLSLGVVLGSLGALVATSFHNLFDVLYVHGMATLLGCTLALASAGRYVDWSMGHSHRVEMEQLGESGSRR